MGKELTHIDKAGKVRMVDVSAKPKVRRTATAKGKILLAPETVELVRQGLIKKGDCLATAKIAGICAAKRTSDLIPLCHNIQIDHVEMSLDVVAGGIEIEALAVCTDKTGIEMEALTAVAVAGLTIYDMCKAVDKGMTIQDVRLVEKTKDEI